MYQWDSLNLHLTIWPMIASTTFFSRNFWITTAVNATLKPKGLHLLHHTRPNGNGSCFPYGISCRLCPNYTFPPPPEFKYLSFLHTLFRNPSHPPFVPRNLSSHFGPPTERCFLHFSHECTLRTPPSLRLRTGPTPPPPKKWKKEKTMSENTWICSHCGSCFRYINGNQSPLQC